MDTHEILGQLVNLLRQARSEGDCASDLLARLEHIGLKPWQIANHISAAFCFETPLNPSILNLDIDDYDYEELEEEGVDPIEALMKVIDDEIEETCEMWEGAPSYPDLMRRRDRHAFRYLAVNEVATVVVAAANPFSGRYIGQSGIRVSPLHLYDIARLGPPNAGLVAADPVDRRLVVLLENTIPGVSYEDYVSELLRCGYTVGGSEEGYVVRDAGGKLLIPGYSVQGVYCEENGANLWHAKEGERIRADLNRRMGFELVRYGTHDTWEARLGLPKHSPAYGPQVPVLIFSPQGNVDVLFNIDDVASRYRYLGIPWSELYPGIDKNASIHDDNLADNEFNAYEQFMDKES